jgi:hypothetical protein
MFPREGLNNFTHTRASAVSLKRFPRAVINIFPGTTVCHHAGPLQLREMTRNARLTHAKNVLQLGHRKFRFLEQKKETQPRRIGHEPE